ADGHRRVGVGVNDAAVLDIDARLKGDRRQIAAHDRGEPEVDPGTQDDVAGDDCGAGDVIILDGAHRGIHDSSIMNGERASVTAFLLYDTQTRRRANYRFALIAGQAAKKRADKRRMPNVPVMPQIPLARSASEVRQIP